MGGESEKGATPLMVSKYYGKRGRGTATSTNRRDNRRVTFLMVREGNRKKRKKEHMNEATFPERGRIMPFLPPG